LPAWQEYAPADGAARVANLPEYRHPVADGTHPLPPAPAPAAPSLDQRAMMLERALVVARVGNQIITAGDLLASLDGVIQRNRAKIPEEQREAQRESLVRDVELAIGEVAAARDASRRLLPSQQQRRMMVEHLLRQQIETKLIYHDARKKIPAEGLPQIEKQIRDHFDETELPGLIERFGSASRREVDQALRVRGTSLEREQRTFVERMLAHQWLRQQVNFDEEVTFDQTWAYYNDHIEEFDRPATIVWEELVVSFASYPIKSEAYAAIARLGNQVIDGADFAEAARKGSEGITASEAGRRRWPDGSRTLTPALRQAIEGLPLGTLSPILEDWRGYSIIRVIERKPAGLVPFAEAQHEVREKLKLDRVNARIAEYLERLRKETPVWTIFDDLPDALGGY
jgi:parvulin-like peptidyl-prolyl isomerase